MTLCRRQPIASSAISKCRVQNDSAQRLSLRVHHSTVPQAEDIRVGALGVLTRLTSLRIARSKYGEAELGTPSACESYLQHPAAIAFHVAGKFADF